MSKSELLNVFELLAMITIACADMEDNQKDEMLKHYRNSVAEILDDEG